MRSCASPRSSPARSRPARTRRTRRPQRRSKSPSRSTRDRSESSSKASSGARSARPTWAGASPRSRPGGPERDLLGRLRHRRRVQDQQRGHDVEAGVRQAAGGLDRRHRAVAEESRPRVGRHRRGEQPQFVVVGQGRVPLRRRRRDVDQRRARRPRPPSRASSPIPRQQHGLRGGARPAVGENPERGVFKTHRRRPQTGRRCSRWTRAPAAWTW